MAILHLVELWGIITINIPKWARRYKFDLQSVVSELDVEFFSDDACLQFYSYKVKAQILFWIHYNGQRGVHNMPSFFKCLIKHRILTQIVANFNELNE